ncbi:MAG TPA: DNA-processing protein DprA [Gemmatimonadaceae bacterium]|nr:DNA-processing protein DprA [Gemmatimonadaceae bacterium]
MTVPRRVSNSPDAAPSALCVANDDARYPSGLADLHENAPRCLWMRGQLELLGVQPRIAIVGTRRATGYGLRVTTELAQAFGRAGACVVSGMALGIDGAAHRGALDTKAPTVAVLGTGLNHCFPKAHRALQNEIVGSGVLLTELEPDWHGQMFTFPARNRLIAALASLTIVVEAPEKSGALITAGHALELDRPVAAVPGPIDQPQSAGCNKLIASGAQIITCVEDALALAGLTPPPRRPRGDPAGDEGRVWAALANGALDMDSLCSASGLPADKCMAAVGNLQVAGAIECALTGQIRRRG